MSFPEFSTLLQMFRALVLGSLYVNWAHGALEAGRFDGDAGLVLMGKALLIYIALTIGVGIVVQILSIIIAIARGEESRPGDQDERDLAIERRATVKGFSTVGMGFVGMAFALWYGWGAVPAIHVLFGGFILADVVVNLAKFVSYWRQRG
jgi:flagellar biosynthesis component FlhA